MSSRKFLPTNLDFSPPEIVWLIRRFVESSRFICSRGMLFRPSSFSPSGFTPYSGESFVIRHGSSGGCSSVRVHNSSFWNLGELSRTMRDCRDPSPCTASSRSRTSSPSHTEPSSSRSEDKSRSAVSAPKRLAFTSLVSISSSMVGS